MKYIIYFSFLILLIACKKKCPDPQTGNVIYEDVIGTNYAGQFITVMHNHYYNHSSLDSTFSSYIYVYSGLTDNIFSTNSSTLISASLNNDSNFGFFSQMYYSNDFFPTFNNNLIFFKNLNYSINSSEFGNITFNDNRTAPTFTNQNSIPLSYSQTSPYIITLNGLKNCKYATVNIGFEHTSITRTISPNHPTTKFYPNENAPVPIGDTTSLFISLVNENDTIISGYRFKIQKNIHQYYRLVSTP